MLESLESACPAPVHFSPERCCRRSGSLPLWLTSGGSSVVELLPSKQNPPSAVLPIGDPEQKLSSYELYDPVVLLVSIGMNASVL